MWHEGSLEGRLRPAHLRGGGRRLALPEAAAVHSERQGGAGRRLRAPVQGKAQTCEWQTCWSRVTLSWGLVA